MLPSLPYGTLCPSFFLPVPGTLRFFLRFKSTLGAYNSEATGGWEARGGPKRDIRWGLLDVRATGPGGVSFLPNSGARYFSGREKMKGSKRRRLG